MLKLPLEKEVNIVKSITSIVCNTFGVDSNTLFLRQKRSDKERIARYTIVFLCCEYTSLSKSEIGQILRIDVSTIINWINRIESRMREDTLLIETINSMKYEIEHGRLQGA